jgi:hypothetical protein
VCLGISFLYAGPGDVPVATIVSDYDSGIAPALQIQSDQLGAYQNSKTLTSIIQSVGAWVLDTTVRNATRTVYLRFSDPIAGSGPGGGAPVAVPSGPYKARIITECNRYNDSMWTLAPGATMPCPMNVVFDYGGSTYHIHMNPFLQAAPAAETNNVNITCVYPSSGAGPCSQWTIAPSATYVAADGSTKYRNVGILQKEVTAKGQMTLVKQGDFYFSFMILVTQP